MRYADANVIKIKHAVLEEVARLAFAGELEERKDEIAFKLIPGPTPQFRCCIYKEREIIRQRVRLAEGKAPGTTDDGNIIQVISSACEDCPISSYTVTENCQNCLGKACINACHFGAIEAGRHRSHIDPSKCKECGKCAEACPYNAIAHLQRPCKFSCPVDAISYDEYGISVIDEEKCIRCGKCIHSCPFGAIGSKTWIVDVINAINAGKHVYAMLAPATEGQFGPDITMASWRKAMKELGFTEFVEVGLGGDLTAKYEAEEWREAYEKGEKKVTSCCPGFVNMVRRHYPELSDRVSTTVSPMCAVSRMIKAKDPEAVTVFIGPCLAKRVEAARYDEIDGVITFAELAAIFMALDIDVNKMPDADMGNVDSFKDCREYAISGGVAGCVLNRIDNPESVRIMKIDGLDKKTVRLMSTWPKRAPEADLVEVMVCQGGCIAGPGTIVKPQVALRLREQLHKAK